MHSAWVDHGMTDAEMRRLFERIREENAVTAERFGKRFDETASGLESRIDGRVGGLEKRFDDTVDRFALMHAETRRHFDATAERLESAWVRSSKPLRPPPRSWTAERRISKNGCSRALRKPRR
ncbi:MAG TPA: hypothetical protein VNL91_03730 [Thermoanaerobaculia bacterium]|nr:hypothetical protein [Thermoanaerobaculia bacterium]